MPDQGDQQARGNVRAFLFDAEGSDQEIAPGEIGRRPGDDRRLLWVDVDVGDGDALRELGNALGLEQPTIDRLGARPGRPYLEDFDEYLHLNCLSLEDGADAATPVEIDCVVGRTWVLTAHRGGFDLIGAFLAPVKGETQLGRLEGPVFLAILLDRVVSGYFRALERLEGRLDGLDEALIAADLSRRPQETLLGQLVGLRREVTALRRSLAAHREMLATLAQPEFDKVSRTETGERFRLLAERLEKAIAEVENARLMVMGSLDVLMTKTAERTNDVMKILTVINAVLLPALVAAAILGMNFRVPFFEQTDLFWVVLAAMAALGAGILAFARSRGWI